MIPRVASLFHGAWQHVSVNRAVLAVIVAFVSITSVGVQPAYAASASVTLVSGNGPIGGLDANVEYFDGISWVPAYVVAKHFAYDGPIAGTNYINSGPTYDTALPNPTTFRTTFTVPATVLSASLSIDLHADNYADVYLNGNLIGSQPHQAIGANFSDPPENFNTSNLALFQAGVNTLEVVLTNVSGPKALDFRATVTYVYVTKDDCKKGGWQTFVDENGEPVFKNQGDCVSFVETNGKNKPG